MSIFKTVLITPAVLLLVGVLVGLGGVVWSQQQEIWALQTQVAITTTDGAYTRSEADSTATKLSKTIKTANRNFSKLETREDNVDEIVQAIGKLILSGSGDAPSSYKNPNAKGE